jgi:hypothetical protein
MTGYSKVYEAVPALMPTIGGMVFGLLFVFVGLGILNAGRKPSAPAAVTPFGWIFLLFSLLWTTGLGLNGVTRWHVVREGLNNGKYHVVTGRVENLDMSLDRYPSVWFSVAGKDFRFHGRRDTAGFRGAQASWLMQPEQEVRLYYVCQGNDSTCIDPIILRAEVRNDTPLPVNAKDSAGASSASGS